MKTIIIEDDHYAQAQNLLTVHHVPFKMKDEKVYKIINPDDLVVDNYFTVLSWIDKPGVDTYKGVPLKVMEISMPYLLCEVLTNTFTKCSIDTRQVEICEISKPYCNRYLGI
jgi:hypothetical protein